MSRWYRVGIVAAFVGLDVAFPAAVFLLVLRTIAQPLLSHVDAVAVAPLYVGTGDGNGEAWFYWWLHRAVVSGGVIDHPDVICAPRGLDLGNNFPTRVDAWLALPFFHYLPFPRSFNAAAVAVLGANMFGAWLGLRAIRAAPPVAVLAAAVVGASDYAIYDISLGHNANALVGPAFAFMGAWAAVAEGRWAWAPVAAISAMITVFAYPPFALVLAPVAALQTLFGLVPREGRLRRVGGAFVAGLPALAAARSVSSDLSARGFTHANATVNAENWRALRADSLTWEWPIRVAKEFNDHHAWLPTAFLLAGALVVFGRWRSLGWAVATVYLYVLSLGGVVMEATMHGDSPLHWRGGVLTLPLAAAIKAWPTLVQLRPYRFAPLVAGALAFAIGSATRFDPPLRPTVSKWQRIPWRPTLTTLAASVALFLAVRQARDDGHLLITTQPWVVPPAITWLADQEGDFALIEMPMGQGQGYGAMQVVHGKRRSEGHHDVSEDVRGRLDAPAACYTDDLVRALWSLERGSSLPSDMHALRASASANGFRYVVVYRSLLKKGTDGPRHAAQILAGLYEAFGAAVRDDGDIAIYDIAGARTP